MSVTSSQSSLQGLRKERLTDCVVALALGGHFRQEGVERIFDQGHLNGGPVGQGRVVVVTLVALAFALSADLLVL